MIGMDVQWQRGAFRLQADLQLSERVTGVFGPSGSGKSTLLALLAGLALPDHGRIEIDGETLFDAAQKVNVPLHRRRIGTVFQDSRLFPHLTVQHNLAYGYQLLSAQHRRFSLAQITDLLEIGDLLQRKPHQLSGGQKQRVALGRALLASPRLLLLDEPLASLDNRLKQQILPFLRRVKEEIDIPMVYVSHAIDEILYLTPSLLVMDHGEVIGQGLFHDVMHDTRVLALASSLGVENLLNGQVQAVNGGDAVVQVGGHHVQLPLQDYTVGDWITLAVGASQVALATQPVEGLSIQNQLAGTVTEVTRIDRRALVQVDIGASIELLAEISAKSVEELSLKVGGQVFCLVKSQGLRVYGGHAR